MKNRLVADILYKIADLLDIKGEIFFKTRAYRMAAQAIEVLDEDIETLVKEDRAKDISGVGKALDKKIKEIVETGELKYLKELEEEVPESLLQFLEIPGLGPKKVAAIFKHLDITSVEELKKSAEEGRLRDLDGFGEITERNILRGIKLNQKTQGRVLLNLAYDDGQKYLSYLKKLDGIKRITIAGSLRRRKETIGDLDILVSSCNPDKVMDYFVEYHDVQRVLLKGSTKTSVMLNDSLQVDLRVVEDKSFGSALQYFTGSKEHNVKMRGIAIKQGFKLNEYGLFDKESEKFIVGKDEKEIYHKLGLQYIPPELRENRGEIEAALENKLPSLVELEQVKGDFHVHSVYSDGQENIKDIADYCRKLGYQYVVICDHSQSLKVANGLQIKDVDKKIKEISRLNQKSDKFRVFCGTECDIKPDGSLDYPDEVLKKFDFVGIGIHTSFKMNEEDMTQRVVKGLQNPQVDFMVHPTCRLIGGREPIKLDMEKVFEVAAENNVYLEINCFPDRLDLKDLHVTQAKDKGVGFVLGTDAHMLPHLDYLKFGVATARRGWLEKKHVLNTKSLSEIEKMVD